MNKRLFLWMKSLIFPSSRNFVISLRQEKYHQLERRQNLLTKQQKVLTQEQEREMTCKKIQSELQKLKIHKDLDSYLSRKNLNPDTTVHKGTLYEYETILCLHKSFGIISNKVG